MKAGPLPAHAYAPVGADERRFPRRRLAAACSLAVAAALAAALVRGRPGQLRNGGALSVQLAEQIGEPAQPSLDERLDNGKNVYYIFNITLGGQTIKVIPDTGSFALVVTSTRCPEKLCIRQAFDPDAADGYTRLEGEALMDFGSGQIWTKASRAPLELGPFEAQQQSFREIVKMDRKFSRLWRRVTYDGILGLPWLPRVPARANLAGSNASAFNETTVLENFAVESFAVCLAKATYDSHMHWTFGASRFYWNRPEALGSPEFTYLDVVGEHHWQVELRNVSVSFDKQGVTYPVACHDKPCSVMIDTGSGVFTAPSKQHGRLRRRLGPIDGKCLNFDLLPSIRLRLGGEGRRGLDVTLPPRIYADKLVLPPVPHTSLGERRLCTSNFEALDFPEGDIWTFGHPFLQEFLVEYDRKMRQVGVLKRGPSGGCPGHTQHLTQTADLARARSGAVEMEHGPLRSSAEPAQAERL